MLLEPVLDVYREPVNNFFHVLHFFFSLSSLSLSPCPIPSPVLVPYPPISVRFKALFLSNMTYDLSFVFKRLRGPFMAQRMVYEVKM